jgi:hypothetical protein
MPTGGTLMLLGKKLRYQLYLVRGFLGSCGVFGPLHAPLFLVGSPNSGTRVLARAIAVHPDIADHSEARLLWDREFHKKNNDTHKTARDVRRSDIMRLRGNFCYYQWVSGKPLVMNRHPENSLRIHFMKTLFPEAKLVHIVRDGRAAVCSNYLSAQRKAIRRKYPFGGYLRPPGWRDWLHRPVLEQLAYMWNFAALYASREGKTYGADYLEIRYEDLPHAASTLIPRVWEMLGLSYAETLLPRLPTFEDRNDKWKQALSPEEVATIERLAREGLEHFGYLSSL